MNESELIVYAKYDEHGSIIAISSNIFIDDLTDWKEIDRWKQGDRYLYSHAGNGEYVVKKHGKPLYDEKGKPNFHDDFIEWSDEEKESLYPTPEPTPTEQDLINADLYMQLAILESRNMPMSLELKAISARYDLIKKYYDMGIYTKESLKVFITCGWITEEEYQDITKESEK